MSEREPGEHLTQATALQLATIIANHWHDAGYREVETGLNRPAIGAIPAKPWPGASSRT